MSDEVKYHYVKGKGWVVVTGELPRLAHGGIDMDLICDSCRRRLGNHWFETAECSGSGSGSAAAFTWNGIPYRAD